MSPLLPACWDGRAGSPVSHPLRGLPGGQADFKAAKKELFPDHSFRLLLLLLLLLLEATKCVSV